MSVARKYAPVAGRGEPEGGAISPVPSSVSFTLPMPPSTNALFRNVPGKGRVKTRSYSDWQSAARFWIRRKSVPSIGGYIVINIGLELPLHADIDNRIKPLLDFLSSTHGVGIIDDDRNVTTVIASRLPVTSDLAHIEIRPVGSLTAELHPAHSGASAVWTINAPFTEGDDHGDPAQWS